MKNHPDDSLFNMRRHDDVEIIVEAEENKAFLTTTFGSESTTLTFDAEDCRFLAAMFAQAAVELERKASA